MALVEERETDDPKGLLALAVTDAASFTVAEMLPAVAVRPTLPVVVMVPVDTLRPDRLIAPLPA